MKFIHLTDTHFVPHGRHLYGLDPRGRLEAAVADINRVHADAEVVMVTGDLAHRGEEDAYLSLRAVLAELTVPVLLLLGNHDDRAVMRRVFPANPVDADGFVQFTRDTAAGRFVALDTNEPGTSAGVLCERRLAWAEAVLAQAAADDVPVHLFLHHPPFDVHIPSMDRIGLGQKDALAEIVSPHAGRIRHLWFGHLHRPISGSWLGIPFSTVPGINHQVPLALTEPAPVPGCHEPPAYAVVLTSGDRLVVHQRQFLDTSPRFLLSDRRAVEAASPEALLALAGEPDRDPALC